MPTTLRAHRMLPALLVLTLLAGAPSAAAQEGDSEGAASLCADPFGRVKVTVVPDEEPLRVEPERVEIYLCSEEHPCPHGKAEQVCWVVDGLTEGQRLHLRGKGAGSELIPGERRIKHPRTEMRSGRPMAAGTWRYELWITEAGSDRRLHHTDPEVIIRDKWD